MSDKNETQPYQPSNGTEGEWFMSTFCANCIKQPISADARNQCDILMRTFFYSIGDKEYPKEWIKGSKGKTCTAFKSREEFNRERRLKRKPYRGKSKHQMELI